MRTIIAGLALMVVATALAAPDAAVRVTRRPPEVVRKTFDPRNPPGDMPPLSPGEAAVTDAAFGVYADFHGQIVEERKTGSQWSSRIKVTSIHVTTDLTNTIWLPTKAAAALKTHEEAHRRLSEIFYEKAEQAAADLARLYIGREFTGQGPTPEAARKAAIQKGIERLNGEYLAAIQAPAARVNDLFDQITDHGRNKVSDEEGMREALERYRRERR